MALPSSNPSKNILANNVKATKPDGDLQTVPMCWLFIPDFGRIYFKALPDISDSKGATYNEEAVIGRATPIVTYSHSNTRAIGITIYLYVVEQSDAVTNLRILRAIQSLDYPRDADSGVNAPFVPPPICKFKCGSLLADSELCLIMTSYSTKFPRDVPWADSYYTPWHFTIDTQWNVVYKNNDLPGQNRILNRGR